MDADDLETRSQGISSHNINQVGLELIPASTPEGLGERVSDLRATFFGEKINIYLHFMSFLHTNKTQIVEMPPRVKQGPAYSTQSISWLLMSCPGDARSQGISNHDIDLVKQS